MSQQQSEDQNEDELEIQVPKTFGQRFHGEEEENKKNHSNLEYSLSLEKHDASSQQEAKHRGSDVEVIQFAESNFNFEKTKNDNFYQESENNIRNREVPQETQAYPQSLNNTNMNNNFNFHQNPYQQQNPQLGNPVVNQYHPTPKINNFQSQLQPIQTHVMPIQYQQPPEQQQPTQYVSPFNGYYNNQGGQFNVQQQKKKKKSNSDSDSEGKRQRHRHSQGYVQPAVIVPVNCVGADPVAVNLASNVTMYCCLGLFNRNDNCCQWMCDCIVYLLTFPIIIFKKLVGCLWGCCLKELCSVSCPKCHDCCSQGCGKMVSSFSRCCVSLKNGTNACCLQILSSVCSCINFTALGAYIAESCRNFWRNTGSLLVQLTGLIGSCCVAFGEQFAECCCFITGKFADCMGAFMQIFGDVICKLCELVVALLKCC